MTKFIVIGTQSNGTVTCAAVGSDGSDAADAFEAAVASGEFSDVELIRYPKISKRWRNPAPEPEPAKKKKPVPVAK